MNSSTTATKTYIRACTDVRAQMYIDYMETQLLPDNLSYSQRRCLAFIAQHIDDKNYAPSIREIQSYLGYKSHTSVTDILDTLRDTGLIESVPNIARSIRLIKQDQAA